MPSLGQLLREGRAGLTVYSPDCAQSRLWGNLDHAIRAATGFEIVGRRWINHDINSILRFYRGPDDEPPAERDPAQAIRAYDDIPPETLQPGHLVVRLLLLGPSLVTLWRGEEAVPALLQAKGVTQPAEAAPGSVRGGFWCDNGVCNLMHSSDDAAEAERELAALKLSRWLDEDPAPARLIDPVPAPASYAAHSGISVACEAVRRVLAAANAECPPPRLPESGGARETNRRLSAYLREAAARHPAAAPFVEAFLAGDLVAVTAMLPALPVTGWERFAIQCGAVNRDRWNAAA